MKKTTLGNVQNVPVATVKHPILRKAKEDSLLLQQFVLVHQMVDIILINAYRFLQKRILTP
jgi:hypothetical protein